MDSEPLYESEIAYNGGIGPLPYALYHSTTAHHTDSETIFRFRGDNFCLLVYNDTKSRIRPRHNDAGFGCT